MQHWAWIWSAMGVQPPSTFHVFYSCIFIIVTKQNFLSSWIEAIHCTVLINIRKVQIIHLQIVGMKSSSSLKSVDGYFVVNSLSFHSTIVFNSTVFAFASFWIASVLQFPAPMQIVVSMNMFRLVKLEITFYCY